MVQSTLDDSTRLGQDLQVPNLIATVIQPLIGELYWHVLNKKRHYRPISTEGLGPPRDMLPTFLMDNVNGRDANRQTKIDDS